MRYHSIMVQMVRQRAAIYPLACLTAFTVTGITWAKILQEGERLDVNGTCTTTNDILSHPRCKRLKSQRHVSTGFPDSRMKRKRRVGFSREDNVEDDFLWPFWETFQESLSGNAEGNEKNPEHLQNQQLPPAGTLSQDYGREYAVRQAGRHLASIGPAMDPSLYPNGGTYHHPIAVFLVSGDESLVYYTTDGTPPDEISSYVTSGDLIVVENSVTVRAVAVHRDSSFTSTASSEIEATFVVYSAGKCGYAYFVPHFTRSGYSGKIVEVDLRTNALGSVRLRNVVTDFADFYAAGGVGPYDGQVVINDLVVDGDKGLAGYWGGFSGDVDGTSLGFLSPHYNGNDFHGKAVKIQLNNFRANTTRFCSPDGGLESNATCLFSVIDLEKIDPDLRGFSGGFLYDKKAYFVPFQNARGAGAKFVRISASNFSADSVEILDLRSVDPGVGGFFGGFASEGYGYLVPSRSFQGPVGGVNSNLGADGSVSVPGFLGNDYSSVRKPAGRLEPAYSGKLVRVDLADFSSSGVEVLDLTVVDPDLRGFTGGFVAGHWGFLVPFKSKEGDKEFSGKMVRFDLRTFDYAGVTVLDLARVDESLRGFVGGFVHGRYAILSPYANGNITSNYRSRSQFSLMVVVDLQDFSEKGVSVVDLAETSRQQVPYQPDPNLRGYVGGFALGPHVYLTPHFNGIFFGKVVRVDMREILTMAAGERASRYDGLQVLDLALESADAVGFSGAFHSWDTSCS